tara:strand:+ start:26 stop:2995 length:2970 start_codon:yes stop_codon:yes gene_type:complete
MLEWGWTPFIDNNGDIETIVPKIGGFFTKGSKINDLQDEINKRKVDTGGNYDGFLGVCKNFEFKATPAGGYECSTDIIAMGEVLEGLKGKRSGNTLLNEASDKIELDNFEYYLTSIQRLSAPNIVKLKEDKKGTVLVPESILSRDSGLLKALNELIQLINPDEEYLTEGDDKTQKKIEYLLDMYIIQKEDKIIPDGLDGEVNKLWIGSPYSYIRWDFLSLLMNKFVLAEYQKDENIAELSWYDKNKTYYDYVRTKIEPEVYIPTSQDKSGNSNKTRPLSKVLDISLNPFKALLPHQIPYTGIYGTEGWLKSTINNKGDKGGKDSYARQVSIGYVYLGVEYLLEKYKSMRYNSDGDLNEDFKILNFLKEIWEKDINEACGGSHNFMLHHDKEDTTKVRVIDLIFQSDLKEEDLYQFNIQDNKSIVRDFNFNSTIPSALSATMGIIAQNPDSINDMEGITISSMNKGLTSRFSKPIKLLNNNEEIYNERLKDEKRLIDIAVKLFKYQYQIARGAYGGNEKTSNKFITQASAASYYKSLITLIESLLVRYPLTQKNGGGGLQEEIFKIDKEIKAGHKRTSIQSTKSSIIPLKFTCKIDGIGGIVIGNVFKINKKRLPIGYQGKDIAFMTHAESQTITSGQDWTTEISGQLLLLDINPEEAEYSGKIISDGDVAIKQGGIGDELPPTPEADKIRELLDRLGFSEKNNQISDNGDITEEMGRIAANILIEIYLQRRTWDATPQIEITAGNDTSHKGGKGRHDKGRALDFVLKPRDYFSKPKDKYYTNKRNEYKDQKTINRIENIIQGFVGAPSSGGTIRYLNEYNYASPDATAPHFHLSYWSEGGTEGGPKGFKPGKKAFQQNYTGMPGNFYYPQPDFPYSPYQEYSKYVPKDINTTEISVVDGVINFPKTIIDKTFIGTPAIDNLTLSQQRYENIERTVNPANIQPSQYYATNEKYEIDDNWYQEMKANPNWPENPNSNNNLPNNPLPVEEMY